MIVFLFLAALAIGFAILIVLGVASMLPLIFTFILWAAAGFPDNKPTPPTPQQQAEMDHITDQLDAWEKEDAERHEAYQRKARKVLTPTADDPYGVWGGHPPAGRKVPRKSALLDAQKRVHHDD